MEKTKLSIGKTLKESFALYKKNFRAMLNFALVVVLCTLPVSAGIYIMGVASEGLTSSMLGSDFTIDYSDFDFESYLEDYDLPDAYAEDVVLKANAGDYSIENLDTDVYDYGLPDGFAGQGLLNENNAAMGKFMAMMGSAVVLLLVSAVLSLIFGPKAYLGAQIYLADTLAGGEGEPPTIKSAYAKTKGKVLTMIGYGLLLGLIAGVCVMPLAFVGGIVIGMAGMAPTMLLWVIIPLVVPMVLLIQPWSFLLTPVVALDEQNGSKLSRTSQLIKGNLLRIACVAAVALLAGSGLSALGNVLLRPLIVFLTGGSASEWLITALSTVITAVISMLTFGFCSAAALVTYQALNPQPQPEAWVPEYYAPQPQQMPQAPAPEEPAAPEESIAEEESAEEEDIPEA